MLKKPIIIVNFKTYPDATGQHAIKLAKICEHVATEMNANIAIAVQALDVFRVSQAVGIPVLAQHVDGFSAGAHTGSVIPEALKNAGAAGSLINHSEWRIPLRNIAAAIDECHKHGLSVVACADTPENAKAIARLHPTMLAIEPPDLIGGKVSVSAARPEILTQSVNAVNQNKVKATALLCGAGIHTRADVAKAVELGMEGVLVASGVVLSRNPEQVLKELVAGLEKPI